MKITIAQLNYHVGNFEKNSWLIISAIKNARLAGSDLVIFSELSVSGYPPLDLLDRADFVKKCDETVLTIAKECRGITAIIGAPTFNRNPEGKKLFNSALALSEGKIIFTANKSLLPTYDIFDEYRYFEPERNFCLFSFMGKKIALTICEDLWDEQPFDNEFEKTRLYTVSPAAELAKLNPDLIINISASPFSYSRIESKKYIFINKAKKYNLPVIAVNQTGANTELIFDGGSLVINPSGKVIARLPFFREETLSFHFDDLKGEKELAEQPGCDKTELIHNALVTGIKDYFGKMGFSRAILGLSGGIDSAVCLYLATEALGNKNVRALLMPSRYSSPSSVTDAVKLSENLGVEYDIVSIDRPFSSFGEILAEVFRESPSGVTEENLQARIRAVILMAYANRSGYILLNTSNKSEAAVGYGTLYGDMAGGLSVIGDVYKTDVYSLAAFINRSSEIIPLNIINKPPSAELRPDQLDTDSLPPYGILDEILHQYIELQRPVADIIQSGFDAAIVNRVLKMINTNEYKRYQAPPILRISSKAFGAGRRMPLVAKY